MSQLTIFTHRCALDRAIVLVGSVSGASLQITEARGKGGRTLQLLRNIGVAPKPLMPRKASKSKVKVLAAQKKAAKSQLKMITG